MAARRAKNRALEYFVHCHPGLSVFETLEKGIRVGQRLPHEYKNI